MSFTQIINYNNPTDFIFNPTKISISADAQLALVDKTGLSFSQDFSSDAGFNYSASLTEFNGTQINQIDQTPTDSILGNAFTVGLNADWNKAGSVTRILTGTPTYANGVTCSGSEGVAYDINDLYTEGAIKFIYRPSYSGGPPSNVNMIWMQSTVDSANIGMTHSPSGDNFRIWVKQSPNNAFYTATTIGPSSVGLVAGTDYEMELNWNNSNGSIRLFIDGNLHGSLSGPGWVFDSNPARLYLGASSDITYNTADGAFDDVVLFDQVQHTSSYTPGYTVPTSIYIEDLITMPLFDYVGLGNLQGFVDFVTAQDSNIKFNLNGMYWTGSNWSASDDSYSEMSNSTDINDNIQTLPISDSLLIKLRTTSNNNSSEFINSLAINYLGQEFDKTNPEIIELAGVTTDALAPFNLAGDIFVADITEPANTDVRFLLNFRGELKWFDGVDWVVSSGNILETNTAEEINNNYSSLDLSDGGALKVRSYLVSSDGLSTPILRTITFGYSFSIIIPKPDECQVYGSVVDSCSEGVEGAEVCFYPEKPFFSGPNFVSKICCTKTDVNGQFDIPVVETETINKNMNCRITYVDKKYGSPITKEYRGLTIPNTPLRSLDQIIIDSGAT